MTSPYTFEINSWGEKYIEALHRNRLEEYRYAEFFERYLNLDFQHDDTLYVVIGSDSGLLMKYANQAPLGRGSRIVFIEPDEVYEAVVNEYPSLEANTSEQAGMTTAGRISLHRESRWSIDLLGGDEALWLTSGQVEIMQSHCCCSDYPQVYLQLFRQARLTLENHRLDVATRLSGKMFVKMQLRNAADNTTPLKRSKSFGNGCTAIVLGGGPSLDNHIDWIIQNRDSLFILAASRICKKLQELDLKPDIVVSIDPYNVGYDVSKFGILWDNVPLVCNYHVTPQLLQEWRGPAFYLGPNLPWHLFDESYHDDRIGNVGPTVGHAATVVASQLGFSQILLTGVDLCFSPTSKTHTSGSLERVFEKIPTLCDAQVETYSGQIAGTRADFLRSKDSLEKIGEAINQYQPVLFNLSEDALKISSIPYRAIGDVELPDSKPDFQSLTSTYESVCNARHLDELRVELKKARASFQEIAGFCRQAKQIIRKMYKRDSASTSQHSLKLDKLDKKLEKNAAIYMKAIKDFSKYEFTKLRRPTSFLDMSDLERKRWIVEYYAIVDETANIFLHMLDDLESRIEIRTLESQPASNLELLMSKWQEDGTPGRVLTINDDLIAEMDTHLADKFRFERSCFIDSLASAHDTEYARSLESNGQNIDDSIRTLLFMHNNNSQIELANLSENLEGSSWPYNALQQLSLGLLADLQQQPDNALHHFQTVVDLCSEQLEQTDCSLETMRRILEESLVRLTQTYLTQNEPQQASTTLSTLCELLPQYIMTYANLLYLLSEPDAAVELLEFYINTYNGRWRAAILLADIYTAIGQHDNAVLAMEKSRQLRGMAEETQYKAAA